VVNGARDDAGILGNFALCFALVRITLHGVRLASSCLPVGEYAAVKPFQYLLDNPSHGLLIDKLLVRRGAKNLLDPKSTLGNLPLFHCQRMDEKKAAGPNLIKIVGPLQLLVGEVLNNGNLLMGEAQVKAARLQNEVHITVGFFQTSRW